MCASSVCQGSPRTYQESDKVVSRVCQACSKDVSKVFERSFMELKKNILRHIIEVSCCMAFIAAIQAEEELVYSITHYEDYFVGYIVVYSFFSVGAKPGFQLGILKSLCDHK